MFLFHKAKITVKILFEVLKLLVIHGHIPLFKRSLRPHILGLSRIAKRNCLTDPGLTTTHAWENRYIWRKTSTFINARHALRENLSKWLLIPPQQSRHTLPDSNHPTKQYDRFRLPHSHTTASPLLSSIRHSRLWSGCSGDNGGGGVG